MRNASPASLLSTDQRPSNIRIRLKIPQHYRNEPILSTLAQQHHIRINILAALLTADSREGGWFDLSLEGVPERLSDAILHINDLGIEVWGGSPDDDWGW